MKEEHDIEEALAALQNNFAMLQVCYLEGLAESLECGKSYPEISYTQFMMSIQEQQQTEHQQKQLPRAQIELCFQRATRGDDG
jgi:hypothetical protein